MVRGDKYKYIQSRPRSRAARRVGQPLAAAFLIVVGCVSCDSGPARPPNVILILADDLGYGDTGAYGAVLVQTPNIDRLMAEGRRFTDAHSPSAVCTPTRYALMTGRYAWRGELQSGVLGPSNALIIEDEIETLPRHLQDQGYTTACIGKWHLGFGDAQPVDWNAPLMPGPLEIGFDYYFGVPVSPNSPPFVYVEDYHVVDRQPGEIIEIVDGVEISGIAAHRNANEIGRRTTEKAVEFIKQNKDRPFFLYFPTSSIHFPIDPDPEFIGTSTIGPYGDFVHELDWSVGRILDTLDENGLAENTLVIFTSDNGAWSYFTCDTPHRSNGPYRGAKGTLLEGGHRVPLIARWPGVIPASTESNALFSLVDVYATLISALKTPTPATSPVDSVNRWYAFVDEPELFPVPAQQFTVLHSWRGKFAMRFNRWIYIPAQMPKDFTFPEFRDDADIRGGACIIDWDVWDTDPSPEQLYDLDADPEERTNLITTFPDVAAALNTLLESIKATGDVHFSREREKDVEIRAGRVVDLVRDPK